MSKERIAWVDLLRTIGILAVILGHFASPCSSWIYSWHMPFFFFLSGFFALRTNVNTSHIVGAAQKLMLPYFLFSGIAVTIEFAKHFFLHKPALDYGYLASAILWKMDLPALLQTYGFVLWFLPTLFFARIYYSLCTQFISNATIRYAIIALLFIVGLRIELPFAMDNAAVAVLWLSAGSLCYHMRPNRYLAMAMLILIVGISLWIGIPVQDFAEKYFANLPINIAYSFACCYLLLYLAQQITIPESIKPLIAQWGGNTMILLILHPYTNNITHLFVNHFWGGFWILKFFLSLLLLQLVLLLKQKHPRFWIFRYV